VLTFRTSPPTNLRMLRRTRTNVILGADQTQKLEALTAAIPRDKSRLIGELIDDEWEHLPERLSTIARNCAVYIVSQRLDAHRGINAIPNESFRNKDVRQKLEWLFEINQQQIDDFFEQNWRDRYPSPRLDSESPHRDPAATMYFPQIDPFPIYEFVRDEQSPDGIRQQWLWSLPGFKDPEAGNKLRQILKEVTLATFKKAREKALELHEAMSQDIKPSEQRISIDAGLKDAQPDRQAAVAAFRQLVDTGQIKPSRDYQLTVNINASSKSESTGVTPVATISQHLPKKTTPAKPVKSLPKPKPSKSPKTHRRKSR